MRGITQVLMCLMFFGLASICQAEESQKTKKNSRIEWSIEVMRNQAGLYDSESARFRNVRQVDKVTVCGEFNAKNRYGAYIGFTGFIVAAKTTKEKEPYILVDPGSSADPAINYRHQEYQITCGS